MYGDFFFSNIVFRWVFYGYNNYKQMMRKYANMQTSKRPYKTPSPSSHTQLKSPRLQLQLRPSQSPKQENAKLFSNLNLNAKSKPSLLMYKNNLLEQKQQANKNMQPKPESCLELDSDIRHHTLHQDGNGYGLYFNKVSSVYSNIVKNFGKNGGASNSNGKEVRENGFKPLENQRVSTPQQNSATAMEQKLKKYCNQIAKLKNGYKQLEAQHERLNQYIKNNQNELEETKAQIKALKKIIQQTKQREKFLTEQVDNFKTLLDICMSDLQASNQENYKMKQQLYHSTLENKRLSKVKTINSSTSLPQQPLAGSPCPSSIKPLCQFTLSLVKQCDRCRINNKLIIALNNGIENKMLQIQKKESIIQKLCVDLQKMQIEAKVYDKPKVYVKKMLHILELNNQFIMKAKAKQVNFKYSQMQNNTSQY